jgi:hypothetical protein
VGSFLRDKRHVLHTKIVYRTIANSDRGEISTFLISALLFDNRAGVLCYGVTDKANLKDICTGFPRRLKSLVKIP